MGHFFSSVLLAVSSNVDAFAVGIAYGVKKVRIALLANLLIAIVSGLGTFTSMEAGELVSNFLPNALANALGSAVLIAIGIWSIWEALRKEKKARRKEFKSRDEQFSFNTYVRNPEIVDVDKSNRVELKEAWTLAFALTINNLGNGLGAGLSGLNIAMTTGLTFITSLLAISIGYVLGSTFTAKLSGSVPGIASGVLIIALGIYEYSHV
ncbi:MAG: sporulation membrane protein YtaF [Chroococcidiopsidaceae cyanobacterium CP_BM_RX_35]|nr:sporulation membrane protein YtaF [Chroococcidiopsidaceae cyanobacterium CP_BM_RX_35]